MSVATAVLLLLITAAASAAVVTDTPYRCFTREYVWRPLANSAVYVIEDFDTIVPRPLLLTLADVTLAPASTDRCVRGQHVDQLLLGWRSSLMNSALSAGVPFAAYPVHCRADAPLRFAMSSLGSSYWGDEPIRTPRADRLYAPQYGRVDMSSGVASPRETPVTRRTLTLTTASGSARAPEADTTLDVVVCALSEHIAAATFAADEWVEILYEESLPRVLPYAECVRAYGGHCGVNIGYTARVSVNLTRGRDENRLHPTSIENGFLLPEAFTRGTHTPSSFTPHMHLGWPCDRAAAAGGFIEAKWHLDGWTLHLDEHALRCADAVAMDNGQSDSDSDSGRENTDWDSKLTPALQNTDLPPPTHEVPQYEAVKAGHGRRSVCTEDDPPPPPPPPDEWWILWVVFGVVFVLLIIGALFISCASDSSDPFAHHHHYRRRHQHHSSPPPPVPPKP